MENVKTSSPKLETDRSIASFSQRYIDVYTDQSDSSVLTDMVHVVSIVGMTFFLHSLIMIFGMCSQKLASYMPYVSQKWKISMNYELKIILFWSTCFVFYIINITCFVIEIIFLKKYLMINVFALFVYIPPFMFMFIELSSLLCCLKKPIFITSRICCVSDPWFIKLVYSLAICNMFWFAHRVGNCFVVSMYFIAMFPAPTIAIITLLLSFIVLLIAAISGVAHTCISSNSKCCEKLCKTLMLIIIIVCLVCFIFFFTLIFVMFTLHGLSAASLGPIILSITIPLVMLLVSVIFKRYFSEVSSSGNNDRSINEEQGNIEYQPILGETM